MQEERNGIAVTDIVVKNPKELLKANVWDIPQGADDNHVGKACYWSALLNTAPHILVP